MFAFDVDNLVEVYPQYIEKDGYVKGNEADLMRGLHLLKKSDFNELWQRDIFPLLNSRCSGDGIADNGIIEKILSDISVVQRKKMAEELYIFIVIL